MATVDLLELNSHCQLTANEYPPELLETQRSKLSNFDKIEKIGEGTFGLFLNFLFVLANRRNKMRGSFYLVFEYLKHDLQGLIDKKVAFDLPQLKCMMLQILKGIIYLHQQNVIHRDIKGANILISSEGIVKLADFGLARVYYPHKKDAQYTNRVVTLWYRAPELLLGARNYSDTVDLWSLGCVFAEMFLQRVLFPGDKEERQIELIYEKCGSVNDSNWPGVSELKGYKEFGPKKSYQRRIKEFLIKESNGKITDELADLIDQMLVLDPRQRITGEAALLHPFFLMSPEPCSPKDLPLHGEDYHEFIVKSEKKQKTNFKKKFAFQKPVYDQNDPIYRDIWKPSCDQYLKKGMIQEVPVFNEEAKQSSIIPPHQQASSRPPFASNQENRGQYNHGSHGHYPTGQRPPFNTEQRGGYHRSSNYHHYSGQRQGSAQKSQLHYNEKGEVEKKDDVSPLKQSDLSKQEKDVEMKDQTKVDTIIQKDQAQTSDMGTKGIDDVKEPVFEGTRRNRSRSFSKHKSRSSSSSSESSDSKKHSKKKAFSKESPDSWKGNKGDPTPKKYDRTQRYERRPNDYSERYNNQSNYYKRDYRDGKKSGYKYNEEHVEGSVNISYKRNYDDNQQRGPSYQNRPYNEQYDRHRSYNEYRERQREFRGGIERDRKDDDGWKSYLRRDTTEKQQEDSLIVQEKSIGLQQAVQQTKDQPQTLVEQSKQPVQQIPQPTIIKKDLKDLDLEAPVIPDQRLPKVIEPTVTESKDPAKDPIEDNYQRRERTYNDYRTSNYDQRRDYQRGPYYGSSGYSRDYREGGVDKPMTKVSENDSKVEVRQDFKDFRGNYRGGEYRGCDQKNEQKGGYGAERGRYDQKSGTGYERKGDVKNEDERYQSRQYDDKKQYYQHDRRGDHPSNQSYSYQGSNNYNRQVDSGYQKSRGYNNYDKSQSYQGAYRQSERHYDNTAGGAIDKSFNQRRYDDQYQRRNYYGDKKDYGRQDYRSGASGWDRQPRKSRSRSFENTRKPERIRKQSSPKNVDDQNIDVKERKESEEGEIKKF